MSDNPLGLNFTWDLLYTCNYRCSYCWWDPHWTSLAEKFSTYPPAERWLAAWERIRAAHGPADISILGGEPLVYPGIERLAEGLTRAQGHHVCVTTNLSPSLEALRKLVAPLSPDRFDLSCSYHPHFADFEETVEKLLFLKGEGFHVPFFIITYPPFIEELPRYSERLAQRGIAMRLRIFRGDYNGKPYPQSLTAQERRRLAELLKDPVQEDYQVDLKPTLGEACYSGVVYANVKPNGDAFRCGQSAISEKPMGNLLDASFRLFDRPAACPFTHCSCQEYEYVAELYEPRLRGKPRAVSA